MEITKREFFAGMALSGLLAANRGKIDYGAKDMKNMVIEATCFAAELEKDLIEAESETKLGQEELNPLKMP